jgi:putative transcriptional regulator
MKRTNRKKRDISSEMLKSIEDFKKYRSGKLTLKTHQIKDTALPVLTNKDIYQIRATFKMSRALFAKKLKISPRSLERWEQGLSKPNQQAILLLALVKKYPDMLDRVSSL